MLPTTYADEQADQKAREATTLYSRRIAAEMRSLQTRVEHADRRLEEEFGARLMSLAGQARELQDQIRTVSDVLERISTQLAEIGR